MRDQIKTSYQRNNKNKKLILTKKNRLNSRILATKVHQNNKKTVKQMN